MGIDEKMQKQGGCPTGSVGRFFGFLMNNIHKGVYRFGLEYADMRKDDSLLDIGCGGGQLLKEISKTVTHGKLYGVDHSEEMVRMALKKNRRNDKVAIKRASVSKLPFKDDEFNVVTAFETIQFWPDFKVDLKEVLRMLKPKGTFLIANRYPEENSNWSDMLTFKNKQEYIEALEKAGFVNITADTETKKGWIRIKAYKMVKKC